MEPDKPKIVVSISSDGSISAETLGIKGEKCLHYVDLLEDILEATTVDSFFTSEYYEHSVESDEEATNVVEDQNRF